MIEKVDESLLLPLLSEPSSDPEMIETALLLKIWVQQRRHRKKWKQRIYHLASLRVKERCSHHLLKSSPNHLWVTCPRASCSWLFRPSLMSARHSQGWHSWTTKVDCTVIFVAGGPSQYKFPEKLADHDHPHAGPSVLWPGGPATTP